MIIAVPFCHHSSPSCKFEVPTTSPHPRGAADARRRNLETGHSPGRSSLYVPARAHVHCTRISDEPCICGSKTQLPPSLARSPLCGISVGRLSNNAVTPLRPTPFVVALSPLRHRQATYTRKARPRYPIFLDASRLPPLTQAVSHQHTLSRWPKPETSEHSPALLDLGVQRTTLLEGLT